MLDLSQIVSGPYCGQLLAALGAEVILVESSTRLISRGFGPFTGEPAYDASAMFNQINQGKRSVQLNLATESGRRLLFQRRQLSTWCWITVRARGRVDGRHSIGAHGRA